MVLVGASLRFCRCEYAPGVRASAKNSSTRVRGADGESRGFGSPQPKKGRRPGGRRAQSHRKLSARQRLVAVWNHDTYELRVGLPDLFFWNEMGVQPSRSSESRQATPRESVPELRRNQGRTTEQRQCGAREILRKLQPAESSGVVDRTTSSSVTKHDSLSLSLSLFCFY